MLTLPIAYREMRVVARSAGVYRGRLISSIVVLLLGIGFGIVYHYFGANSTAPMLGIVAFMMFQMCLFSGAQATADALAKEKRDGTIGLLFLTHLKPFEITLGKLIANGLVIFYGLFIALPLISLAMIAGGVSLGGVLQIALGGLNVLFISASIGLYASSRHTDRKKASTLAVYIILFFWFGLPAIATGLSYWGAPAWVGGVLSLVSFSGLIRFTVTGPIFSFLGAPSLSIWGSMLGLHLVGWLFLGLATWSLKRNWQEHPPKKRFSFRQWMTQLCYGRGEKRQAHRRKLLGKNAFYWLASRNRLAPLGMWVATLGLAIFPGSIWANGIGFPGGVIAVVVAISVIHKAIVAGNAAHRLGVEQEQGTLEMILSTPIEEKAIIDGQILATWRAFRGPVILITALQLCCVVATFFSTSLGLTIPSEWSLAMLAFSAMYLLDLWTMTWLGMWGATIVKEPKKAAGVAMGRCFVLPGLAFAMLASLWSVANYFTQFDIVPPVWLIFGTWFLLGFANDMMWLSYVRRNLPRQLRDFSMRKYSQQEPLSDVARIVVWMLNGLFRRKRAPVGSVVRPVS